MYKHCQRHNGIEGWVHITTSKTNLDQILISESWLSINFKISTKHQAGYRILMLDQDSTLYRQPKINSKVPTKLQLQNFAWTSTSNLDQTFCWKSEQKFSFMTKPQLPNMQQTVAIINISINSNNLNKFWVVIFTRQGQINQVYLTGVASVS